MKTMHRYKDRERETDTRPGQPVVGFINTPPTCFVTIKFFWEKIPARSSPFNFFFLSREENHPTQGEKFLELLPKHVITSTFIPPVIKLDLL